MHALKHFNAYVLIRVYILEIIVRVLANTIRV